MAGDRVPRQMADFADSAAGATNTNSKRQRGNALPRPRWRCGLEQFQVAVAAKCNGSRETSVGNSHELGYMQPETALVKIIAPPGRARMVASPVLELLCSAQSSLHWDKPSCGGQSADAIVSTPPEHRHYPQLTDAPEAIETVLLLLTSGSRPGSLIIMSCS